MRISKIWTKSSQYIEPELYIYYMLFVSPIMNHDEQIQTMINQTMDSAISQIEGYLGEIERSNDVLKISDSKEFVYGLIIGQTLGLAMAALSSLKKEMPTQNDQEKIRDMIYKNVPELRKRLFE